MVLTDEAGWEALVVWDGEMFICINSGWSMACNWELFKVLGNIHENPELRSKLKLPTWPAEPRKETHNETQTASD